MPKVTVKLTMFEDPVEVDEEELPSLRQQGLLSEPTTPVPAAPETATTKASKPAKETS